jgi:hypothetical protein
MPAAWPAGASPIARPLQPAEQRVMATAFAFLGILLMSMVVALLAALQLGDFFGAGNEFGLVILAVAGFTVLALMVFALAYSLTRRADALIWFAFILAALALAPLALPGLVQMIADRSTNPYTIGVENTSITLELVIPALAAVLVQWGLVRRRRLRTAGEDDLSRWPWVTTAVAGLAILNPFGLAFLQSTLRHSPSDFMWEFTATVTAAVLGILLVMAWAECYIRDRMLNRRSGASPPPQETLGGGERPSLS